MRAMNIVTLFVILFLMSYVAGGHAQQPTPMIIVQAANATPGNTPTATAQPPAEQSSAIEAATKALEEVKAANAETIKKQEAMLQQLDELQKAAAQLKIFSHRTGG